MPGPDRISTGAPPAGGLRRAAAVVALARIDPTSLSVTDTIQVGDEPLVIGNLSNSESNDVAVGSGAAWVTNPLDDTVVRVDLETLAVTDTIETGDTPSAVAVGTDAVWVAVRFADEVARIDSGTRTVIETIAAGTTPGSIAAHGPDVWLTSWRDDSASRIDPKDRAVADAVEVSTFPVDVAVGARRRLGHQQRRHDYRFRAVPHHAARISDLSRSRRHPGGCGPGVRRCCRGRACCLGRPWRRPRRPGCGRGCRRCDWHCPD